MDKDERLLLHGGVQEGEDHPVGAEPPLNVLPAEVRMHALVIHDSLEQCRGAPLPVGAHEAQARRLEASAEDAAKGGIERPPVRHLVLF